MRGVVMNPLQCPEIVSYLLRASIARSVSVCFNFFNLRVTQSILLDLCREVSRANLCSTTKCRFDSCWKRDGIDNLARSLDFHEVSHDRRCPVESRPELVDWHKRHIRHRRKNTAFLGCNARGAARADAAVQPGSAPRGRVERGRRDRFAHDQPVRAHWFVSGGVRAHARFAGDPMTGANGDGTRFSSPAACSSTSPAKRFCTRDDSDAFRGGRP